MGTLFKFSAVLLSLLILCMKSDVAPSPAEDAGPATICLSGAHDITISGKTIAGNTLPCITLRNCSNVRIAGNKLYNSTAVGIELHNCRDITIDNNYFTNLSSGVYAQDCLLGGIIVNNNQFLNMTGPYPRGQFVQFDNVSGPGNIISNNRGENVMGKSNPEDAISLYQSSGTPASPIFINGNQIRGGGPSKSGGGIMLGDGGGAYLTASHNILVNPGQYGIGIAGGSHISVINNTIYGTQQPFTNVGIYVYAIGGQVITNATVSGNKVLFYNSQNVLNNAWLAPGLTQPAGWNTNSWGAKISGAVLPKTMITLR